LVGRQADQDRKLHAGLDAANECITRASQCDEQVELNGEKCMQCGSGLGADFVLRGELLRSDLIGGDGGKRDPVNGHIQLRCVKEYEQIVAMR